MSERRRWQGGPCGRGSGNGGACDPTLMVHVTEREEARCAPEGWPRDLAACRVQGWKNLDRSSEELERSSEQLLFEGFGWHLGAICSK